MRGGGMVMCPTYFYWSKLRVFDNLMLIQIIYTYKKLIFEKLFQKLSRGVFYDLKTFRKKEIKKKSPPPL